MFPPSDGEHDEPRWLLKALREAAHELESQLWGLDEDDLRWRPEDDAMSLKEIAAHMRDCEEHFAESLAVIVRDDRARICAFDADALVLDRDYRQVDLYEALERFESLRGDVAGLLWSLEPKDWERTGQHTYRGAVSVLQLAREQNEHDLEHLWQARRLRQTLEERVTSRRRG
jgi:hypothetical protein